MDCTGWRCIHQKGSPAQNDAITAAQSKAMSNDQVNAVIAAYIAAGV